APRTRGEKAVAAIWSALLGRPRIGVDDDFFRLGGHSLLALKVLAQIRATVGVELAPSTLFEHSTVAALAALIPEDKIPATIAPAPAITAMPVTGPVVTSFAQEQLWLLEQLTPGTAAYNVVDVVPLPGPFHREALRRSLKELVSRHATLRTTVTSGDGVPVQVVHPLFEPDVEEVDLAALPAAQAAAEWDRLVAREVRRPFSLAQLPLLRVHAVHTSAEDHRLLFVVHHIVSDEWSMELVQQELGALYEAFRRGEPSPLPPLPIQYTDFAAWQREHLTGEPRHAELDFWKRALSGSTPILALPTDRPRPPNASLRGATTAFTVPGATYAALRELAQRERTSLFMVLHASFAALLGRITGQDDLLVGTP
ncbi:MAG TPA: condensation domain-containing protein, partial [Polyangiaceae bacterium]